MDSDYHTHWGHVKYIILFLILRINATLHLSKFIICTTSFKPFLDRRMLMILIIEEFHTKWFYATFIDTYTNKTEPPCFFDNNLG